jgi:hypothetical protein
MFLDQPIYIALIGILAAVLVGIVWTSTGRKEWLFALGAVIVLTAGMLVVERLVVTDREAIRQTLADIARDVKSNSTAKVVAHIAPANSELIQRAQSEMPNYQFTDCRVTKVHSIDVDAKAEPRTAKVEFNVVASGTFRQGNLELADSSVPRWVRLQLVRDKNGSWKVEDYSHAPPQQMIFANPLEDGANK